MLFSLIIPFSAAAEEEKEEDVNAKEIIFEHVTDAYSWHITAVNGHSISIPLLCIVKGNDGWDFFSASKFGHESNMKYKNYYICHDDTSLNSGKIVEDVNGEVVKPLDLSITKNVLSIFIINGILIFVFLTIAKRYKENPLSAPKGMQAYLEPLVITIYEDVAKACIGKNYKKFAPFILTAFFFIFLTNLMGIIPFFPGGANITGNITVTMILALATFVLTNFTGTKLYWKDIFWPDVPTWLKFPLPIMQSIEIIGLFTKPIALMIRLFANMLSGHMMQLVLICLIFMLAKISPLVGGGVSIVSVALAVFMDLLEVLVCLIQAYVFVTLSSIFIGLSQEEEEGETEVKKSK